MRERTFAIFFDDLKEDAQKRIITQELGDILECDPDSIKVDGIVVNNECYGYDEDPEKQELLQHVNLWANEKDWLMIWDCMDAQIVTIMNRVA